MVNTLYFTVSWNDATNPFFDQRSFVLIYFVDSKEFEVRQRKILSGDVSRLFLRNQVRKSDGSMYDIKDLKMKSVITIQGRNFVILDADLPTKEFVDKNVGPQKWPSHPPELDPIPAAARAVYPPYNGFGDEEDTLGYCNSLHPQPPRKDLVKLLQKDGQVIRFKAKFHNPKPVDEIREFLVAYYMADDTLAISEYKIRNSGFIGGKFINKGKYKNPKTGQNFDQTAFYVGNIINVNGFEFELQLADEFAMNYMEADASNFPVSNLLKISRYVKRDELKKHFEGLDPELCGLIPLPEARKILLENSQFVEHQIQTILRRYESGDLFDYFGFLSVLR